MKIRYSIKELGLCRASCSPRDLLLKLVFALFMASSGCAANSSTMNKAVPKPDVPPFTEQKSLLLENNASGKIIELGPQQDSHYQNLTLRVITIEDSRCAIGVTCIWAGQMVVKLEISNHHSKPMHINLIHKREPETVYALGYSFRLLNIQPHPKKGKVIQLSEQVVQLEVVKTEND